MEPGEAVLAGNEAGLPDGRQVGAPLGGSHQNLHRRDGIGGGRGGEPIQVHVGAKRGRQTVGMGHHVPPAQIGDFQALEVHCAARARRRALALLAMALQAPNSRAEARGLNLDAVAQV